MHSVQAPELRLALENRWTGHKWLENDAHVAAAAEYAAGASDTATITAFVALSTGARLGIHCNGSAHRGRDGRIGHTENIPWGPGSTVGFALSGAGILTAARMEG